MFAVGARDLAADRCRGVARVEHLDLGRDLGRDVDLFGLRCRTFHGRARLDLREGFGGFEKRPLHGAVRVEQTVAPDAQRVDLTVEQCAPAHEIAEHAFARGLRLVEHVASVHACLVEDRLGLGFRSLERGRGTRLGSVDELGGAGLGFGDPRGPEIRGLGPGPLGRGRGFVDQPGGALLGLLADLVARLPRRPQEPGGLLAQRVEQFLFGERPGGANLLFE